MATRPAAETVRSPEWLAAAAVLVAAVGYLYLPLLSVTVGTWAKNPDYSHGFLVPAFSGYLLWRWRAWAPKAITWPNPYGLLLMAAAAALFLTAGVTNKGKEWLQGASLVLATGGGVLLLGGWAALKWAWPAVAFLGFMFPLPYNVEHALGWQLQKLAAVGGTFGLQSLGYPAYLEGVIITVREHALGVERACSGLSMMLTFLAMATAIAILSPRPWLDRAIVVASAVPVAVAANVLRIVATGVVYVEVGPELGEKVFHDFAGWLMMPVALAMIWVELRVLDWVLITDEGQASREDIMKVVAQGPTHLFMAQLERPSQPTDNPLKVRSAPPPLSPATQGADQPVGGR